MLKVAIIDDNKLIRNSIKLMVNSFNDVEVVFEAECGNYLFNNFTGEALDVILLHFQIPLMKGCKACETLRQLFPDIKILIISPYVDKYSIQKIMECGVHGYLTKNSNQTELEQAITKIHKKGFYFDTEIAKIFEEINLFNNSSIELSDPLEKLSEREMEVVKLAAKGYSNNLIAERMFINVRTVEMHRQRIMEKAGAKNFTHVILHALKHHYLSVQDL